MKKIIEKTTELLLQGMLTKSDADKILLDLHNVVGSEAKFVCEICKEPMIEPYVERCGKKYCLGCA